MLPGDIRIYYRHGSYQEVIVADLVDVWGDAIMLLDQSTYLSKLGA